MSRSNETSLTLTNVSSSLTGNYGCEVSEDAPMFHTRYESAVMQVTELSTEEP